MKKIMLLKGHDWKTIITQFVKFGIVGFTNAVVLYVIYYVLLRLGLYYIISYIIAFLISVLNAYLWNNKFVFRDSGEVFLKKILKVYASYTTTFILSTVLLYVWVDIIGVSEKIAPLINICITTPINFVMNKKWAFKR